MAVVAVGPLAMGVKYSVFELGSPLPGDLVGLGVGIHGSR